MICATCKQPIEAGQLYHYAMLRRSEDDGGVHVIVGNEPVHEYPCPVRCEVVDGHLIVGGIDMGDIRQFGGEVMALPSVDPATVGHGLYRIWWRSGGDSLAAVGIASNGDRWIAATNWCEATSTNWSEVIRIQAIQ